MNCYTNEQNVKIYTNQDIDLNKKYVSFWINDTYCLSSVDRSVKYLVHREDDPDIEFANGDKYWFLDGKRHRLDGPSFEGGNKMFHPYHINGQEIFCKDNKEFLKIVSMRVFL